MGLGAGEEMRGLERREEVWSRAGALRFEDDAGVAWKGSVVCEDLAKLDCEAFCPGCKCESRWELMAAGETCCWQIGLRVDRQSHPRKACCRHPRAHQSTCFDISSSGGRSSMLSSAGLSSSGSSILPVFRYNLGGSLFK